MTHLMRRRLIIVLLSVGALLGLLIGFNLFKLHMVRSIMAKNADPPQTVSTMVAAQSPWQPELAAVGSLRAVHGVEVTSEVPGLVRALRFHSGEEVHRGQVLVELNADADVAQLHALEAAADLSQTVHERDKLQFEAQAISQAQLDADAADLRNRRALAEAQAALVAKKFLRAPFDGRLGITTVNPGQYLNAGDKVVTLQSVDPIYVDFRLPQRQLGEIALGQTVRVSTDAFPGKAFTGKITAIDPRVDPATRNVSLEAQVENAAHELLPGMFAQVAVLAGAPRSYVTLPQASVSYAPYGATVFVARQAPGAAQHLVAQQVFVTLGPTRGDQVAVLEGVHAGDVVVTSGQMKLKNGTPLLPDNSVQPRNDPSPQPQEH